MLIRTKVKFPHPDNSEETMVAFFSEEFNPKSTINLEKDECEMKIFFEEKPPLKLIEAISRCETIYFKYNVEETIEVSNSYEKVKEETIEVPASSEKASKETIEALKPAEKLSEQIIKLPTEIKNIIRDNRDISIISHDVAVLLKMCSYESFFESYLKTAFEINMPITWNNIMLILNKKGINVKAKGLRNNFSHKISTVMKENELPSMGLIEFTKVIVDYYNECWGASNEELNQKSVEDKSSKRDDYTLEELLDSDVFHMKIKNMPKNLSEVEKIKYVFKSLNSEIDNDWANEIFQILKFNFENFDKLLSYEQRAKIATDIANVQFGVKVNDFLISLKKFICI